MGMVLQAVAQTHAPLDFRRPKIRLGFEALSQKGEPWMRTANGEPPGQGAPSEGEGSSQIMKGWERLIPDHQRMGKLHPGSSISRALSQGHYQSIIN